MKDKAKTLGISYGKGIHPTLIMDKKIVGVVKNININFEEDPPKISIILTEKITDFKGNVNMFILFDGHADIK